MRDPWEGVAADGSIVTGVARTRVPQSFEPVIAAATNAAAATKAGPATKAAAMSENGVSLYLYGSVATGQARPGRSDVDLLTVGLGPAEARELGGRLSAQFADVGRGVEIAPVSVAELRGESDAAYGNRVFLRHYCVHLIGPDLAERWPAFPADRRAARGFNGDIARCARRWRSELEAGKDPRLLGRAVARKTLLAVSGLVSVHDGTWTTDRRSAASRWAEVQPGVGEDLQAFLAWSESENLPDGDGLGRALDGTVDEVGGAFASIIGLWE